jgi:hypothetical protein
MPIRPLYTADLFIFLQGPHVKHSYRMSGHHFIRQWYLQLTETPVRFPRFSKILHFLRCQDSSSDEAKIIKRETEYNDHTYLIFFLESSRLFRMATVKPSGKGGGLDPLTVFKVLLIEGVNGIGIDPSSACASISSSVSSQPWSGLADTGPG